MNRLTRRGHPMKQMPRPRRYDDEGFARYVADIQKYPRLDREAEQKLARRWARRNDRATADALLRPNLRYVVSIAAQYKGYGFRMADLVEEGNIGLCEALRRFDPSRNLRFMTYASYWIRAYILAHVLKQWSIVGIGTGPLQSKMFFRLHRERARIASLGGDPAQSLATTFQASESRVSQIAERLDGRDVSLDVQAYRDGSQSLLETLRDDGVDSEQQAADGERDARVREALARVWDHLDDRERLIITERLWTDGEEKTLAELGRRLHLSRERVRQLEERVKRKLRRVLDPVALAA
jgi:RNA polymerase sigma-32 factor